MSSSRCSKYYQLTPNSLKVFHMARTIFPLITKCLLVDAGSYNSLLPFVWKSSSWRETPSCYFFYLTDLTFLLLFPLMLYTAKQRRPSYRTRHDRGGLARLLLLDRVAMFVLSLFKINIFLNSLAGLPKRQS